MTREERLENALAALVVATSALMDWVPEGQNPPEEISTDLLNAFELAGPLFEGWGEA